MPAKPLLKETGIGAPLAFVVRATCVVRVKPGWIGGNPYPNPPHNQQGLVDDAGRAKPAFFVAQEIFRRTGPFRR
jgi:hypothetical protein